MSEYDSPSLFSQYMGKTFLGHQLGFIPCQIHGVRWREASLPKSPLLALPHSSSFNALELVVYALWTEMSLLRDKEPMVCGWGFDFRRRRTSVRISFCMI